MKILGFTISILLVGLSVQLPAQTQKTTDPPPRSIERDFVPSALYLSFEVPQAVMSTFSDKRQLEFRGKIDFDRYFLVFDYATVASNISNFIDSTGVDFDYQSKGYFYRIGPQINFLPYNPDRSNIFFGLMYARSVFHDEIEYSVPAEVWSASTQTFENERITANWFEVNIGANARIFGPFFVGYTMRFKLVKSVSGYGGVKSFEIPGFGRANKGTNFGLSYYVAYRFGFRDKPVPPKPPKPQRLKNQTPPPQQGQNGPPNR